MYLFGTCFSDSVYIVTKLWGHWLESKKRYPPCYLTNILTQAKGVTICWRWCWGASAWCWCGSSTPSGICLLSWVVLWSGKTILKLYRVQHVTFRVPLNIAIALYLRTLNYILILGQNPVIPRWLPVINPSQTPIMSSFYEQQFQMVKNR